MITTPLGKVKIYADGICVDYKATKHAFSRFPCKEKPVADCYRIELVRNSFHTASCVLECLDAHDTTANSGENYIAVEFIKNNIILTIGAESDNPDFEVIPIENGLQIALTQPVEKVVFGLAWATDYEGSDDVRTWFAADPTLS